MVAGRPSLPDPADAQQFRHNSNEDFPAEEYPGGEKRRAVRQDT